MTASVRQSLTVVVGVADAVACRAALARARVALETAFGDVSGVSNACLAVLPERRDTGDGALLFECLFEGPLTALIEALFALVGAELCSIFAHCAGFPSETDARRFAAYVSARARRSTLCSESEGAPRAVGTWRRLLAAFSARCHWPATAPSESVDADELEARRGAVGLQDWQPGVPLLHLARLPNDSRLRARVKQALRAIERDPVPLEHAARFLIHDDRLLFLAYPAENALFWSERASLVALPPLTRIWASVPEFQGRPWLPRARRARHLQRFLLDGRAPVGAWFNAATSQRTI